MNPPEPAIINGQPLRIITRGSSSKNELEIKEEAFDAACYSSSSGIVISYKDGSGEVLTSESFDDPGLHFIFSRSTVFQYPSVYDKIGIGSVVQVFWTRSFERVIRGSHIVVQVEKMEVYKCATMKRERVFVTFNSQMTPGVATGITENYTTVAFHPNCSSKMAFEALKAHGEGRTEFVMKQILKNHFMEAYFLQSSDRVYFDRKACHSNILEKVSIGSLIHIQATPAFPSSFYKWYGYDVTLCHNYLADVHTQRSFQMETANEILNDTKDDEEEDDQPLKSAKIAFQTKPVVVVRQHEEVKQKKPLNLHKFNSKHAKYKMRHLLLDQCYSTLIPREAKIILDAYLVDQYPEYDDSGSENQYVMTTRLESDDMDTTRPVYSESVEDDVYHSLTPFGLNRKPRRLRATPPPKKSKKGNELPPKLSPEEVRQRFGCLMDSDGYALNQKVKDAFVMPDTKWKPTERRWIGCHDDLKWVLMATFIEPTAENSARKEGLLGGWWYRRSVPRDAPIQIVKRMETRRNVMEDYMPQPIVYIKPPKKTEDGEEAPPEPLFTQNTADLLGISNLDTPAAELLEFLARQTIKETIRLAANWTKKCARKRMTVADVENVLRYQQNMGQLNISTVDTLNIGIQHLQQVAGTSGNPLFAYQKSDIDVDKEDTETFVKIPRDLRIISYPLVTDGQPVQSDYTVNVDEEDGNYFEKNAPEVLAPIQEKVSAPISKTSCLQMYRESVKNVKLEQKVGMKPLSLEILTVEQQIFMKEIITVCMGQDDKKRHEALYTLETDAGIQVFLPYLTERICKSISANISQRCLSLIIYAGRVLRSLSLNKACDMTVSLHHVIPSLLSCCVGRNMCLRPETDNHWALRDFSAKTLVMLVRDQVDKRDAGFTARRLFDFAHRIFRDSASSFSMIYGTIYILQEFIVDTRKATWLLAELSEMATRCKQHIEAGNRMQTTTSQLSMTEAAKLSQQITKSEAVIRTRHSIPSTVAAGGVAPLNRRFH
ncbi:hypothetical protein GCK72_008037 [Caenorhabditis remanei]|uniref:Transcription initiation factor TFIID subunit 6 n=1 Tax=Caenorhabditis remanei TaxID=31234 RepID=A0A6A5HN41_CAERE|nr:hypothetical protein GCK72_008037 [Caenorhabditis remanei]KAF1768076.1 hypothetical protein GCK72_008037 [Caenorhabditis remanei]